MNKQTRAALIKYASGHKTILCAFDARHMRMMDKAAALDMAVNS